ncbi:MAG: RNA methyltransferase [Pseudomonadota bacterium]
MHRNVRIVLVETSHPGNIGGVARAMKNMGLDTLYLVNPAVFPHAKATARASGADGILKSTVVCSSLAEALQGCTRVYGASARERTIAWPQVSPRACAQAIEADAEDSITAIVFGRERSGLRNDELDQCQAMLHIPCNPDFSSLNLAAAVQVVCYELHVARNEEPVNRREWDSGERASTQDEINAFYEHLDRTLVQTQFLDPDNPRQLRRRLRRLFNRVEPSNVEVNILRGILTSVEKTISRD